MSMSASTVCCNSAISVLIFGCRGSCFIADIQRIHKEIFGHDCFLVFKFKSNNHCLKNCYFLVVSPST